MKQVISAAAVAHIVHDSEGNFVCYDCGIRFADNPCPICGEHGHFLTPANDPLERADPASPW